MKKSIAICLLTIMSVQADETIATKKPIEVSKVEKEITTKSAGTEEIATQLKQAHRELKTLRAEMVAILTVMLNELEDFEITRGIDFNAWNNLHPEFYQEKYQEESDDAEEAEGEQE